MDILSDISFFLIVIALFVVVFLLPVLLLKRTGSLNRYYIILFIIMLGALLCADIVEDYTEKLLPAMGAGVGLFVIVSFPVLWYPSYLKDKKSRSYRGIWKSIGEWVGGPVDLFAPRDKKVAKTEKQ